MIDFSAIAVSLLVVDRAFNLISPYLKRSSNGQPIRQSGQQDVLFWQKTMEDIVATQIKGEIASLDRIEILLNRISAVLESRRD